MKSRSDRKDSWPINPTTVGMLQIADEAAQELAVIDDGTEGFEASGPPPVAGDQSGNASAATFEAPIGASVRGYHQSATHRFRPGFARRSPRLVPRAPRKVGTPGTSEGDGARLFAADLPRKQQDGSRRHRAEV
jgi:hypothetical protein